MSNDVEVYTDAERGMQKDAQVDVRGSGYVGVTLYQDEGEQSRGGGLEQCGSGVLCDDRGSDQSEGIIESGE